MYKDDRVSKVTLLVPSSKNCHMSPDREVESLGGHHPPPSRYVYNTERKRMVMLV